MTKHATFASFSFFISLIAAIGGFLFGYNTSVISGAILFLAKEFSLTTFQQEIVVSTLLIGALVGALVGGVVADSFGRKKTLFFNLLFFFIGTLILQEAGSFVSLVMGRAITGLAIGVSSLAVPLYIAEVSPRRARGTFVSLNQLLITIGILVSYIVSYSYAAEHNWRAMFGFGYIPLVLQAMGLLFIPETPSWLLSQKRRRDAERAFHKLKRSHTEKDWDGIQHEEVGGTKSHFRSLFKKGVRKPFLVGVGISIFQQITGINTVIYYAPKIFQVAGFQLAETALFATVLIGCVNVVFTVFSLWLIDWVGRRPLLIFGLIGMASALAVLGFAFFGNQDVGLVAVGGLMVYVAFFAISLGPVAWLIISEIYPLGIRGRAMGFATFANWTFNYIVSLTFLTLIKEFGAGVTFWMYTAISLLGLWFVCRLVPETKGKTFEEIQDFWKS